MINYFFDPINSTLRFEVSTKLFPLVVIFKASYVYTKDFFIFFEYKDETYINVSLKPQNELFNFEIDRIVGEFSNELLFQNIRFNIQNETKELRQIILGRALFTECVEIGDLKLDNNILDEKVENQIENNDSLTFGIENIGLPWDKKMRYFNNE